MERSLDEVEIKVLSPPTVGKIKVKRVPIRRDDLPHIAPADTIHPKTPRYTTRQKQQPTLITPRLLKPPSRNSSITPSVIMASAGDTPRSLKVDKAPEDLQLNLGREDSMPSLSRASTLYEDRISLSFKPETPTSIVKPVSGRTVTTPRTPSKVQKNRRKIPSVSVKPLQKPKKPVTKRIRTTVVFRDGMNIYKKRVKLVGKVQKKKVSQASRLVKIDEEPNEIQSSTPVSTRKSVFKKPLDISHLLRELRRPEEKFKMKPVDKPQEKPTQSPREQTLDQLKDVDLNFFSCTSNEDIEQDNNTNQSVSETLTKTPELNQAAAENTNEIRKSPIKARAKRKTTSDFFAAMTNEMERVAQRSLIRSRIEKELARTPSTKKKNETAIELNVFSKIRYNYDHRSNSKVKQKQRRNRQKVDLSNRKLSRLPTLINWVECSDILLTPAMKMQNRLTDGSINRDVSVNTKFSARSIPVTPLIDIE